MPGRGGVGFLPTPLERAGTEPSRAGCRCGLLPTPLERQGTVACPAGAPFLGKKWGKEPPGEEVPPPGSPSLVGLCWGRLYFLRDTRPAALTLEGP